MNYYTIKNAIKCLNISEQGLYKKIKANNDEFIINGYIKTITYNNNGSLKAQILLTDKGLKYLVKEKGLKEGKTLENIEVFNGLNQPDLEIKKEGLGLNQEEDEEEPTTLISKEVEEAKPNKFSTKPEGDTANIYKELLEEVKKDNNTLRAELIKVSKEYTKQLQEGLKEQEERLNKRFEDQLQKQADNYNTQLEKILANFNKTIATYQLQLEEATKPQENVINVGTAEAKEEVITEAITEEAKTEIATPEAPIKKKGFFARLFGKE